MNIPPPPPPPPASFGFSQAASKTEFSVVPFMPNVTDVNPHLAAAQQLHQLITKMQDEGWEYVSLSTLQTAVKPTGCGNSNKQAMLVNYQLLIFRR